MAPPLRAFWGVWVVPEVTAGHSSWVPGHPLRLPLQAVTMAPRDLSPPPSNSFSRDTAGSSSRVCRRGHPPHCPWRGPQALGHPPRSLSLARGTCRVHAGDTRLGHDAGEGKLQELREELRAGHWPRAGSACRPGRSATPAPNLCTLFAVQLRRALGHLRKRPFRGFLLLLA